MGLSDFLKFGKKEDNAAGKKGQEDAEEESGEAKYADKACALCGRNQTEKQWAGQYWHKKCFRQVKKGARKMI